MTDDTFTSLGDAAESVRAQLAFDAASRCSVQAMMAASTLEMALPKEMVEAAREFFRALMAAPAFRTTAGLDDRKRLSIFLAWHALTVYAGVRDTLKAAGEEITETIFTVHRNTSPVRPWDQFAPPN